MARSRNQQLLDLARRLQTVTSYEQLLGEATEDLHQQTRYRSAWLGIFSEDLTRSRLLTGIGGASVDGLEQVEFSTVDDPMLQEILSSDAPIVIEDARRDPRPRQDLVTEFGNRTMIHVPLVVDDHHLGSFGVGTFAEEGPIAPTAEELDYLVAMASHLSVALGRLRTQERNNVLKEQLRRAQKREAMGRLAGGLAHDLNNLLTAVLGNVELSRLEPGLSASLSENLDEIEFAAGRATELSRQLLAFSAHQVIEPRSIDVNEHLDNLMKMLSRLVPENVAIDVIKGSALGTVRADPGQLDQVVMNLVLNSRDAIGDSGTITIETRDVVVTEETRRTDPTVKLGRFVGLRVTDTGTGMSADVLDEIFDPFYTTKGVEGGGTGLGLSVVLGIVEQHGGFIRVETHEGSGTSFDIYLPITDRAPTPERVSPQGTVESGTEHILVVEDDERVANVVRSVLSKRGYRVTVAEEGRQALAQLAQAESGIDLVVSDVVMPHADGGVVWRALRERDDDIPMLVMTGYATSDLLAQFGEQSDLVVLHKPFRPQDLLRKVRELLDASAEPVPAST